MIIGVSGLPKSGKTTFIKKFLDKLDVKNIFLNTRHTKIENILEILVDKYYMNGILIGKFNFKKRDYCKWIDIKKEELDEDKLIKVYLQSRFYLKIDDKNIINEGVAPS